jgi:magnesium transporter
VPQLCAGMREYFRDVFDHLQRIHGSIEGIRDMQTTAIQVNLGMINLNETEVTKKLAGWAAIIAVPTLIAGIYGMNFKDMPEYDLPYAYPICIVVMIALDILLYRWFRKIRWL